MTSEASSWGHRGHRDGSRYALALQGELDMSAVDELQALFTAASGQAPVIDVNLDVRTFIDSAVISTLIDEGARDLLAGNTNLGTDSSTALTTAQRPGSRTEFKIKNLWCWDGDWTAGQPPTVGVSSTPVTSMARCTMPRGLRRRRRYRRPPRRCGPAIIAVA